MWGVCVRARSHAGVSGWARARASVCVCVCVCVCTRVRYGVRGAAVGVPVRVWEGARVRARMGAVWRTNMCGRAHMCSCAWGEGYVRTHPWHSWAPEGAQMRMF